MLENASLQPEFRYYWVSYLLHVAYKALKEHLEKELMKKKFFNYPINKTIEKIH